MKLYKIDITKAILNKLSEEEQIYLVQLTHFLNELNILYKCVLISGEGTKSLNKIERRSQVTQVLFFIRILAGKLNEGWEMMGNHYFGTQLSKEDDEIHSEEGKDSLKSLKSYFSRENNVNKIRNQFAFHYDLKIIKNELSKLQESDKLEMILSEHQGNCLYSFSDAMVLSAILTSIDPNINPNNDQSVIKVIEQLIDEIVINVVKWFQGFGNDCILIIGKKLNLDYDEVEIPEQPFLDEIRLPFFAKKPES